MYSTARWVRSPVCNVQYRSLVEEPCMQCTVPLAGWGVLYAMYRTARWVGSPVCNVQYRWLGEEPCMQCTVLLADEQKAEHAVFSGEN